MADDSRASFETQPVDDDGCARCGSSLGWEDCPACLLGEIEVDDDDGMCSLEQCHACEGRGGWDVCLSSADWCQANPLPGCESTERTS